MIEEIIIIISLFTLGSIYSAEASWAEQQLKQIIPIKNNTIWPRDYREPIQLAVRAGLELRACELQVRPRCLQQSALSCGQMKALNILSIWLFCLTKMSMWVFNKGVNPELTQEALEQFLLLSLKESRKQINVIIFTYLFFTSLSFSRSPLA